MLIAFPGEDGIFQQDTGICHTTRNTNIGWKSMTKTSKYYPSPLSPQTLSIYMSLYGTASVVVFALWAPCTLQQLWDVLQSALLQIPVTIYHDLIESFPASVLSVLHTTVTLDISRWS